MKNKLWKLFAIFAVLGLIAVGCGDDDDSSSSEEAAAEECELARGVTDDKILFGSSQPLTGNLAALGEQAVLAMEVTRDRINEGGGINGRMIELSSSSPQPTAISPNTAKMANNFQSLFFIISPLERTRCTGSLI